MTTLLAWVCFVKDNFIDLLAEGVFLAIVLIVFCVVLRICKEILCAPRSD